uniref:Uncharacterized protein n=1 Tax=Paracidobacterium acidisoli TaxID=2303751 RepID=A0A372IM86_9BACT
MQKEPQSHKTPELNSRESVDSRESPDQRRMEHIANEMAEKPSETQQRSERKQGTFPRGGPSGVS